MRRIEITEEEHAAIQQREGLEALLNRVFAEVRVAFWEESSRVIAWMTWESIPFLKAMDAYLVAKPHLSTPAFVGAAYALKGQAPNRTPLEILQMAERMFTSPPPEGESGDVDGASGAGAPQETDKGETEGDGTTGDSTA